MAIELPRVVAMGVPDDYEPLTPRDEFTMHMHELTRCK